MQQKRFAAVLLLGAALVMGGCSTASPAAPASATSAAASATPAVAAQTGSTQPTATEATPVQAAQAATNTAAAGGAAMAGMDHGAMTGTEHAAMMGNQPSDLLFIDSMIPHHEGAIKMAQQALTQAEHPEIKAMAQNIIDSQQKEIGEMQQWRTAWYTDTAPTMGMGMDMGTMDIPAGDQPFDLRFIDAMIPHHEGAVMMAQAALAKAEHPEIKTLAQAIIDAQQKEIAQLKAWRAAWYPDAK